MDVYGNKENMFVKFIIVIASCALLCYVLMGKRERFGPNGREFVKVGAQRFGLRGDKTTGRDISLSYYDNDRNFAMHPTGNPMWINDITPFEEGHKNCKQQIDCHKHVNEYGESDACFKCGSAASMDWGVLPLE